jgi:WD40 repeat protein
MQSHASRVSTLLPLPRVLLSSNTEGATGGRDRKVCLWELDPLKLVRKGKSSPRAHGNQKNGHQQPVVVLEGHTGWVRTVEFAPNGLLASGAGDTTIRLWVTSAPAAGTEGGRMGGSIATVWQCTAVLQGHTSWIRSLSFSVKEGVFRLVSASNDATLRVWSKNSATNTTTGADAGAGANTVDDMGGWAETAVLTGHRGPVFSCCSRDNWVLYGAPFLNRILRSMILSDLTPARLKQASVWPIVFLSSVHYNLLFGRSMTSQHRRSTGADRQLRVWAVDDGVCLKVLPPPAVNGTGRMDPTGAAGGAGAVKEEDPTWLGVMNGCAVQGDGTLVAASGSDGTLCGWRSLDWAPIAVVKLPGGTAMQTCAFASDGQQVLAGGDDRMLRVWATTGTSAGGWHLAATLPGHAGGVLACAMVPSSLCVGVKHFLLEA